MSREHGNGRCLIGRHVDVDEQGAGIGPWVILGLITLQVLVGAGLVTGGLPPAMQVIHVAVGVALWAAVVIVAAKSSPARSSQARAQVVPR